MHAYETRLKQNTQSTKWTQFLPTPQAKHLLLDVRTSTTAHLTVTAAVAEMLEVQVATSRDVLHQPEAVGPQQPLAVV